MGLVFTVLQKEFLVSNTNTIDFTSIKSYIRYNVIDSMVVTYCCPIRLREYPQLLMMARKLGVVVTSHRPEGKMFTALCKLKLSGEVLVCYPRKPLNLYQFKQNVRMLFNLMQSLRPDIGALSDMEL